ncbi:hypothetical protein B0J17DRAFT_640792 [Rhizoctonia solani]|nr:hypothetical protein B0J17DRAFT_640792 [Rhizoctonia solani]
MFSSPALVSFVVFPKSTWVCLMEFTLLLYVTQVLAVAFLYISYASHEGVQVWLSM